MPVKGFFPSKNRSPRLPRRNRASGGGAGQRAGDNRPRRTSPHLEQPLPSQDGVEPCPLCGFKVEPRRLHFHMVRVHGVAFRHKAG